MESFVVVELLLEGCELALHVVLLRCDLIELVLLGVKVLECLVVSSVKVCMLILKRVQLLL